MQYLVLNMILAQIQFDIYMNIAKKYLHTKQETAVGYLEKSVPFFANQENANEREGMKKGKYLDRHKAIDFYRSITSAPNLFFWQNSFQNISSIILKRVNAKNAFVQFVHFFLHQTLFSFQQFSTFNQALYLLSKIDGCKLIFS